MEALIVAKKNHLIGNEMEKSIKETTVQTPNKIVLLVVTNWIANNPIKSIDLAVKGFGYRMSTSTRQHLKTKHCHQPVISTFFRSFSRRSLFLVLR